MKNYLLILIVTICSYCNKKADKYEYIVFELAKNKPKTVSLYEADTHRTDSVWTIINQNPKACIEYLMTFKGHREVTYEYSPKKYGRIGFSDDRITYVHNGDIRNNTGALHLICAIYYNNYFFSSDRLLYNNDSVCLDEFHQYYKTNHPFATIRQSWSFTSTNTDDEIRQAWQLVELWWAKNKNKSIGEIRAGERPFGNSKLYWYGEIGGKVNKNFTHKFVPYYDKSEKQ